MPTYCYEYKREIIERVFRVGEAPRSIQFGGHDFKRCFAAERVGVPPTKGWPIECLASGVHASQAKELQDHFQRVGVPTEVSKDGNPIYRDAAHRRKALKARGFVDRASFV